MLYSIYAHPPDFPGGYVVRARRLGKRGQLEEEGEDLRSDSLETARRLIPPDLHRMDPFPTDDPSLVEVWL